MNLAVECPVNTLSFGNVSYGILNEFRKRGLNPNVRVIGGKADCSNLKPEDEYINWIEKRGTDFLKNHSRKTPLLKIWHINDSLSSFSEEQSLFTFYELDSPTKTEINILKNQKNVFVSSKYTKLVFEAAGLENVTYCPLGFDSDNFYERKVARPSAEIVFGLVGKLEKRKAHHKILRAWSKKYGNNKRYALNCAIQNPFIDPQHQSAAIINLLEGKRYFNINFLGFMPTNELYNEFLNANDIILGMSHAEGFGLPEFHSLCLGKHGVILNAHAYKDWANKDNSVLVEAGEKIPAYDGTFFREGGDYNQGQYFDWDEDEFIAACELAETKFLSNPVNEKGRELKKNFNYQHTANVILDELNFNY